MIDPKVFNMLPKSLLDQIEGLDTDQIDELIKCGQRALNTVRNDQGVFVLIPNPMVYIAVMIDSRQHIHGFVWVEFDTIERLIFIQAVSVARAYQSKARAQIVDHLFNLELVGKQKEIYNICRNKIRMATARPNAYGRSGWKKSPMIIMEIENVGQTDTDPGSEA